MKCNEPDNKTSFTFYREYLDQIELIAKEYDTETAYDVLVDIARYKLYGKEPDNLLAKNIIVE